MISIEYMEKHISIITISRNSINALSFNMVEAFHNALNEISNNSSSRVLIIRSDQKHFCAGADLKERAGMSDKETMDFIDKIGSCFNKLASLSIPTIALIHGAVLGGGLELALACDFRLSSDSLKIGLPETSLGIIPGAGGTQRLPMLVGLSRAKEMIFSGSPIDAHSALRYGLIDYMYSPDEMFSECIQFSKKFLTVSSQAISSAKIAMGSDFTFNLDLEKECYANILKSPDRISALKRYVLGSKKK